MRLSKFGWLAALVALAAVVGAVAFTPSADAAVLTSSTKACVATATINTFTCTYTVNFTGATAFTGDTTLVTMAGPATFTTPRTAVTNNPVNCSVTVAAQTPTTFQYSTVDVVAGGCALAATTSVIVTETIAVTGAAAVTQTALNGFSGTSTTATATGATFVVGGLTTVTKACTAPAIPGQAAGTLQVGVAFTCVVTVTFAAPGPGVATPVTVAVTGATPAAPGPFTCAALVPVCTFTETLTPTTAGTLPAQTVTVAGTTFNTPLTGVGPTVLAAGATSLPVTMTLVSCNDALNTNFNTTGAPVTVRCVITLRDNGSNAPAGAGNPTTWVSSGIVTVTLGDGPFGVLISNIQSGPNSGTIVGPTATVRCGPVNTQDTCDRVEVTITITAPATVGAVRTIGVDAAYVPDNPQLNTPSNLNRFAFTVTRIAEVRSCRDVVGMRFVGAGDTAALSQVRPGQIAPAPVDSLFQVTPGGQLSQPLAIGILPNGVTVNVIPLVRNSAGTVVPVGTADVAPNAGLILGICPAKFEISSVSGTLLSLSGTLTTNLRILCGSGDLVRLPSPGFDLNTCTTGVTFAVLGLGVGNVEINVRYEPLDASLPCVTWDGFIVDCDEFEGVAFVTFVAPTVQVVLALAPNPVAVGATTTATATLRTVTAANCAAINPVGAAATCIDPTTGRPILAFTDPGSILNGLVIFSTADAAIARFQEGGANASTTLGTAVVATASQVVRECGAFSGGRNTVNPFSLLAASAATPIAAFFGGCETATATLVGVNPGSVNIAAAFIPFLPGAAAALGAFTGVTASTTLGAGLAAVNFFAPGIGQSVSVATLQVAGVAPTGNVNLVRGCNNITPTVTEAASAYIARVTPPAAVISIWQHNAATNTFTGAPGPGSPASAAAVADLTTVTRLTPVFVCVNAAATLAQPPA